MEKAGCCVPRVISEDANRGEARLQKLRQVRSPKDRLVGRIKLDGCPRAHGKITADLQFVSSARTPNFNPHHHDWWVKRYGQKGTPRPLGRTLFFAERRYRTISDEIRRIRSNRKANRIAPLTLGVRLACLAMTMRGSPGNKTPQKPFFRVVGNRSPFPRGG